MILDFTEAVSWLGAALRPTSKMRPGLSLSDIRAVCKVETDGLDRSEYLEIQVRPEIQQVQATAGRCWHSLFRNPTIVNYNLTDSSSKVKTKTSDLSLGYGLELQLRDLIMLSGADLLMEHNGSLIYFGYSTILVPIRRLSGGYIQWHLLRQEEDKMLPLATIDDDEVCRGREPIGDKDVILLAKAHFLGLWHEALIVLGTEGDQNYVAPRNNAFSADKKVKISDTYSATVGGNLAGPNFTLGRSAAYARTQITMDFNYRKLVFLRILQTFRKKAVLIYESDPVKRRAWLVPTLSLVLHAAHLYFRSPQWDRSALLKYADPAVDGDSAAWAILAPNDTWTSVRGYAGTNPRDREDLELVLTRIVSNMLKFSAKLVSESIASRIHGYDLAALLSDPTFKPVHTDLEFLAPRKGWWRLTERVPIYLCHTISRPVRKLIEDESDELNNLPANHLICPMTCLDLVADNAGYLVSEGKVSNNIHFHSPQEPLFDTCACDSCTLSPRTLDARAGVQYLIKNRKFARKWDKMSHHMGCAVLVAPKGGIVLKSSPRVSANSSILETDGSSTSAAPPVFENGSEDELENDCLAVKPQIQMILPDGQVVVIDEYEQEVEDGQPESSGSNANNYVDVENESNGDIEALSPKNPEQPAAQHTGLAIPDADREDAENWPKTRKGKEVVRDPLPPAMLTPGASSKVPPRDDSTGKDDLKEPDLNNHANKYIITTQSTKERKSFGKAVKSMVNRALGRPKQSSKSKGKMKDLGPLVCPVTPK